MKLAKHTHSSLQALAILPAVAAMSGTTGDMYCVEKDRGQQHHAWFLVARQDTLSASGTHCKSQMLACFIDSYWFHAGVQIASGTFIGLW